MTGRIPVVPAIREPTAPDDIPVPTAEGELLTAFVEAFVATIPREEALAFLQKTAEVLASREERSKVVVTLRKSNRSREAAKMVANRQAVAMFREALEGCVARMNELGRASDD